MKVSIINATADAVNLLIFTKQTRLNMTPGLMGEIRDWSPSRKAEELAYMAKTIPSSWEFVDITFLIEGISRACAQQVTRTRTASYAMQSQRVTDVRNMPVVAPDPSVFKDEHQGKVWDTAIAAAKDAYSALVDDGFPAQDARGLLPMNVECNLVAKYNLRALSDLLRARQSLRAQGEYVELAKQMKAATLAEWPWAAAFFTDQHADAIKMIEDVARQIGITTGKGPGWELAKAIDLLRKS